MTDVQVTSINRQPGTRTHEGITHLGGTGWRWTRDQVARSIALGTNTFYILDHGLREELAVEDGTLVRARTDGRWTGDLLALPDCPLHEGPVTEPLDPAPLHRAA